MNIFSELKTALFSGFNNQTVSTSETIIALLFAYGIAVYIHFVYKHVTSASFYNKNYGIAMIAVSVVTAGVLLAMQSSLVISLGMVGALSIVRFRTAIKDPMDLLFLFWSISIGIICGAGLFELALIVSVVTTGGIVLFQAFPIKKKTCLMVVNAETNAAYDAILEKCAAYCKTYSVRTKNLTKDGLELIVEVCLKPGNEDVVEAVMSIDTVVSVNLLSNDA